MADFTIETYWNVETLYYVFNAVAAMMGSAGFAGLLKTVFVFSIGIGMFAYVAGKQLELAQWFVQALIFTSLLNMPIARVTFADKTNLQPPRVVANVPFAMAMVGQMVNMTFGFITSQYETAFGIPDELGLAQGDVGFGHRILKQINHAEIQDPGLRADLLQFIKECTLYDIKDGQITPQQIVGGTNVWQELFSNTTPARFVTYDTLTSIPITDTCQNVAQVLKDRVNNATTAALTFYGKQAFPLAQSDAMATNMFISATGAAYDWILQSSQNSSDAMRQAMFNNIWHQAGTTLPAMLNDPAQVGEVSALMGEAQAAAQANGSNSVLSLLGQETLPHMRNWLEAILYALFPVIVVLMIASTSDGAKKILGGYMMSLAWIGLWPVLFAVINHMSLMYLRHKANALALTAGVPFQMSDVFDSTLINEQAQIGYLVVLVPFIASAIIRLGQGGFMSVADQAISGFNSNGAAAGAAAASGNFNMGQVGLDTQSVNTTSMHKMDYNFGLQGGGASIGMSSGGVAQLASDGSTALQTMNNRFVNSISAEDAFSSQRTEEAYFNSMAGTGRSVSNRHSNSSSFTDSTGNENAKGTFQTQSAESSSSREGSTGGSSEDSQSLHTANRDTAAFHAAAGARDNLGANFKAGRDSSGTERENSEVTGYGKDLNRSNESKTPSLKKRSWEKQVEINDAIKNRQNVGTSDTLKKNTFSMSGGIGFDTGKYYSAEQSRNKAHEQSHSIDETVRHSSGYQDVESQSVREGEGQQSSHNYRKNTEAALGNSDEHSDVNDAIHRSEYGVGNRSNRGENHSYSLRRDMLSDVEFMKQVASRNGMSPMRFYGQSTSQIIRQAQDYAEERDAMRESNVLRDTALSGDGLLTAKSDVEHQFSQNRSEIRDDITSKHVRKSQDVKLGSTEKLEVNTSWKDKYNENKNVIDKRVQNSESNSLPGRAIAFDENVQAWASYDKKVGEGRANPMTVVEATEIRDAKDSLKKGIDKLTGGDGTGDGEKLNENKIREDNAGF